ncbi:MAG: NAD(P)H-dependent glycerol-3-phosphate dehydrogenase [Clostridia bacterium]|nr:NAD(P)H-dependent glycerol-3-phosphate dehydrogenase [Clostridia bacterium]
MKIAVIGSGSWGCALAAVLADNGNDVCLWSYFKEESEALKRDRENKKNLPGLILPENISYTSDLETAVLGAEVIVIVTPSSTVGDTAEKISSFVKDNTIIVCASKGFDSKTQKTLTETIKDYIPSARVAALSGPSHAEEVAKKMPTMLVAASEDLETAETLQDLFTSDYLRIYTSSDVLGVELGGALKNIIALCAGISDGLGLGDNTKAALMTRGMSEIARLGLAMGASVSTFSGLSGMGDLIVTCTSMHSRNRRAGILIGQGKTAEEAMKEVNMVVEGVYAVKEAYRLSKRLNVEMPITEQAYRIIFEGESVKSALDNLMKRKNKYETESGFVSK